MPPAMFTADVQTYFAPAGRDSPDELACGVALVENTPLLRSMVDAMPAMVVILNANRQIVAANAALKQALNVTDAEIRGRRPGELIGCVWATEGPDGCGTGRHCLTCGAVEAILASQETRQRVVRECRVVTGNPQRPDPLDVRVTASPFPVDGQFYVLAALEDISRSKRLDVLQRAFFHDVLNTAGCVWGYARCLDKTADGESDLVARLVQLSEQLIEEIKSQQELVSAENGELAAQFECLDIGVLLDSLRAEYLKHPVAVGRKIELRDVCGGMLVSDLRLLRRVLGNMIKNALEATEPGRTVSLRALDHGGEVTLAVHNCEVMSDAVQYQIFQRSFSTKGQTGRGVGTYSMRLFGERYLGGKVSFLSHAPEGTTFMLTLPRMPAQS